MKREKKPLVVSCCQLADLLDLGDVVGTPRSIGPHVIGGRLHHAFAVDVNVDAMVRYLEQQIVDKLVTDGTLRRKVTL